MPLATRVKKLRKGLGSVGRRTSALIPRRKKTTHRRTYIKFLIDIYRESPDGAGFWCAPLRDSTASWVLQPARSTAAEFINTSTEWQYRQQRCISV